ncbi:hypothetical protein MKY29_14280 [Psychrobacillus sp. FSL K6-2365]|uniref:hypothetical protein n=1 Tax=Psychrobacillus sp. FSL K6-2365 TaxID=2921546 RepID=UPI0030FC36BB
MGEKYRNILTNLLGYIGVILILVVIYKLFFDYNNQFYSGILFIGVLLLIYNVQLLKKK